MLHPKDCSDEGMVGSMVYGVVEGSFDAGYLISVRIGNNLAPFRGVVFQPRKVVAVTAANDVAPQAVMYERREMQVPVYANASSGFSPNMSQVQGEMAKQQACAVAIPDEVRNKKLYPRGDLRMVEEDEVMQAFEVSTSTSKGGVQLQLQEMNKTSSTDPPPHNLYYNQNSLFNDELGREGADSSSISKSKSPNLNLDLAFKNPNIGYHQALVAGNPLLLPPDLIPDHEPLDFIMDRPKTPTATELGVGGPHPHNAITNEPYYAALTSQHQD